MTIRLAEKKDIPQIQTLLKDILTLHHTIRPDIFKEEGAKYNPSELEQLLHEPSYSIFVYQEGSDILGYLICQLRQPSSPVLEPIKTLFIDDLCVTSQARGKQIGQKLYQYALDFAREQDCYNLTLDVWADNEGAVRFYERLGLKPQKFIMETLL